ncbi:polysaccharide biosynthesis/export family protein [Lignipirellula cremea]|uniref:Polysaccharide biosynthesis/export protein n=1 Tax=Lignipirellula cremea TaxID=2528010 RepID=A0A518DZ15_9BACT|nr:polysaccharide biosynthesis/export family protein [Lignipirellula cremea]QDU97083.1 Polysaccharide biosynthesis/export protein [Lignipirellula cremea]
MIIKRILKHLTETRLAWALAAGGLLPVVWGAWHFGSGIEPARTPSVVSTAQHSSAASVVMATPASHMRPIVAAADGSDAGKITTAHKPIATETAASQSTPGDAQSAAWFVVPEMRTQIQLCQALGPAAPYCIEGVDSADACGCGEMNWGAMKPIPWQAFAQGEYVGPHRLPHTPEYRLRVDDSIEFIYRLTREMSSHPYELNVGDEIRVESLTDDKIDRPLVIQPDGTITLRLLGQVRAARRTVDELRADLEERYKTYYKVPAITVTPLKVNTKLEDLRATVDSRAGQGGQGRQARVSPDGTVQLPGLGSIPALGMTLDELKREVDERYAQIVDGIEVTPALLARAPRRLFVVGEVRNPGVYEMNGPTSVMMAISQAGGWNIGGNLREIIVFRRAEDWRLLATKIDVRGALYGESPTPADEIWLRDTDIVVVPKMPIQVADDFIELIFTRGIYGVVPLQGSVNFAGASTF